MLPTGFYAVPFLDREGPTEIDVATLGEFEPVLSAGVTAAAPPWLPPAPGLAITVEWPSTDDVRVEVFSDDGDPHLVAAIELVSPRNKDRPRARAAFAAKCADHLRHGCGLVIVDVVTTRRADLHGDLLAALGVSGSTVGVGGLSVVSYRSVGREEKGQLLAWPVALEIGGPLPTVPLWLGDEMAVPLALEASHAAACLDLRVQQAG